MKVTLCVMADNSNIVMNWAVSVAEDAHKILINLEGKMVTREHIKCAYSAAGEIKGACEAIIITMKGAQDRRCPTCSHFGKDKKVWPCKSCRFAYKEMDSDLWDGKQ